MAETRKGQKYLEVLPYSYRRDGKVVKVPRHDRSSPNTAKGKKRR